MSIYVFGILGLLCLALCTLAFWISSLLLYARRQTLPSNPTNYGLPYEEISFSNRRGLQLKGWWIPAPREEHGGAVIMLHPMFGNRCGFRTNQQGWPRLVHADVDLLDVVQRLHRAGYAVLAFDFRSHGESARGLCAGGMTEEQDVAGAVDYIFNRVGADIGGAVPAVGLIGFGLGAAAAIAAVGREKGGAEVIKVFVGDSSGGSGFVTFQPANVKKLSFLVAVQPASLGVLVRGVLKPLAPLSVLLVPLVDRLCQWRGGYPLDATLLRNRARELTVPTLYIQSRSDPWGDCAEVLQLYDVTPAPKQIWWIEESLGRLDTYNYVGNHLGTVLQFAAQYLPAQKAKQKRPANSAAEGGCQR